jgi:molybdate transport system permease protein
MSGSALLLSFQVASAATALAGALGVLAAWGLARRRSRWGDLAEVLCTAPMVLPPTVLGYALLVGLGRESAAGRLYEALTGGPLVFSRGGVLLAAWLAAFPLVVRGSRAAMEAVDPRLEEIAATLGAPPWRVFWTVTLPLARNGILASMTLGFARALGDFGVTLMLGGNLPGLTRTGALAIYDAVQAGREAEAAGMVALLTAIAMGAMYLAARTLRQEAP